MISTRLTKLVLVLLVLGVSALVGWRLIHAPGEPAQGRVVLEPGGQGSAPAVDAELDAEVADLSTDGPAEERESIEIPGDVETDARSAGAPSDDDARTHTLRIQVNGPDGAPVPGCPVAVTIQEPSTPYLVFDLLTDSSGLAAVGVPGGSYYVTANGPRRTPAQGEAIADLSMGYLERVVVVEEDVEKTFVLRRLSASLEVEVVDDLGAPVEGVKVRVASWAQRSGSTDAEGRMVAERLLPGRAVVRLDVDEGVGVALDDSSKVRTLDVLENRRSRVRFVLKRYGAVKIRIAAPLADHGTSVVGDPSEPAGLLVTPLDRSSGGKRKSQRVTMGEFHVFSDLAPGLYSVEASFKADSELGLLRDLAPVEVLPGEVTERTLEAIRFSGHVSGRLLQRDGRPAAGVFVIIRPLLSEKVRLQDAQVKSGRSDDKGRFAISGLREGPHEIQLNVDHLKDVNYALPDPSAPFFEFRIPGPELVITLDPGATIAGRLGEGAGQLPKEQKPAQLEIDRYRFPSAQSFPIEDGEVTIRHLRAGPYRLRWLNAAGESLREERVVVPDGGEVSVVFGER
ncbi:hypothetical protein Poly30_30240 [Planctomycetes bacterium Poly30]|uniref:Uncharacterized protein n=1 Tax=Saltatorellus ferox TaxID=2528018 RepID=A0A518ETT4_9BACT|nr:hypothetical protein Poly30_30240 [Planctomycetes bacterium Poly30]